MPRDERAEVLEGLQELGGSCAELQKHIERSACYTVIGKFIIFVSSNKLGITFTDIFCGNVIIAQCV
jgi:hypothetical protein